MKPLVAVQLINTVNYVYIFFCSIKVKQGIETFPAPRELIFSVFHLKREEATTSGDDLFSFVVALRT